MDGILYLNIRQHRLVNRLCPPMYHCSTYRPLTDLDGVKQLYLNDPIRCERKHFKWSPQVIFSLQRWNELAACRALDTSWVAHELVEQSIFGKWREHTQLQLTGSRWEGFRALAVIVFRHRLRSSDNWPPIENDSAWVESTQSLLHGCSLVSEQGL